MKLEDHWKPNLFVAGFSKCGTTALCDYLSQHPDIYVIKGKEPWTLIMDFIDDIKFYTKIIGNINGKDLRGSVMPFNLYKNYYKKNYKKIRVDGSVIYTAKPYFASILKEFSPSAKVLLCIRDQKSRLISLYLSSYPFHRLKFDKWIDTIISNIEYIDECLFYNILHKYENLFGNSLLVIRNEVLQKNPSYVMNNIFNFLDLETIDIKPLISNPTVFFQNDPFYNFVILPYKRAYKINFVRQLPYNSIIRRLLVNIHKKMGIIIDKYYNLKKNHSNQNRNQLMSKIPNDLKQLLDEDYKRTVDFCKTKNILLE